MVPVSKRHENTDYMQTRTPKFTLHTCSISITAAFSLFLVRPVSLQVQCSLHLILYTQLTQELWESIIYSVLKSKSLFQLPSLLHCPNYHSFAEIIFCAFPAVRVLSLAGYCFVLLYTEHKLHHLGYMPRPHLPLTHFHTFPTHCAPTQQSQYSSLGIHSRKAST